MVLPGLLDLFRPEIGRRLFEQFQLFLIRVFRHLLVIRLSAAESSILLPGTHVAGGPRPAAISPACQKPGCRA